MTRIILLKPHTHAGRLYPVDVELDLVDNGIAHDSATWLINLGVAAWGKDEPRTLVPRTTQINETAPDDGANPQPL